MYCNKENVNILTSLLVAHGVRHAVVCPGSRNAPIVHNLNACPAISCFPVTDERSAGFYALGMTQALDEPVAVCVTSGTALLNVLPAVAEAYYQQRPLVVISADRPPQWIDQLDGQTLPQPDALGRFVRRAVSLPEPADAEGRWFCNRLVNEALLAVPCGPVHINVPITEPLFCFDVAELPKERKIELLPADIAPHTLSHVLRMFMQSERPLLISGQPMNPLMDEAVSLVAGDESYVPSLVVCIGGSIVSKRLKRFLRKAKETWVVNATGEVTDTFMNLTRVIQGDPAVVADQLHFMLEQQPHPFVERWNALLARVRQQVDAAELPYSPAAVVRYFERRRSEAAARGDGGVAHYANSTAIRLANTYSREPVFCNRGVNGIEGSLSTAAGFSCVTDERVFCVIGDLSFFYDQNALWNRNLRGNLRVLLLNNGHGAIFDTLPGLEQSPSRDALVAGRHQTTAEGICRQNDVVYLTATDMAEMQQGVDTLFNIESLRPVVLEVTGLE
jgi:2-succinyl-5-enolpyruvyl-6-hydroxy-3-cyclohexene-1-carboxylate synthase